MPTQKTAARRARRKKSIRKRISGTSSRPRFTVYRSNKHIYAQVIDDSISKSLASVSTRSKPITGQSEGKKKSECAKLVGELLAESCLKQGISQVVFDRNGYMYHGRVSAVAEGARKGGLKF